MNKVINKTRSFVTCFWIRRRKWKKKKRDDVGGIAKELIFKSPSARRQIRAKRQELKFTRFNIRHWKRVDCCKLLGSFQINFSFASSPPPPPPPLPRHPLPPNTFWGIKSANFYRWYKSDFNLLSPKFNLFSSIRYY